MELLVSVHKNRATIEAAVLRPRCSRFLFMGSELMFVWELQWEKLGKSVDFYTPIRAILHVVEKQKSSQGPFLSVFLRHEGQIKAGLAVLSPGQKKKVGI